LSKKRKKGGEKTLRLAGRALKNRKEERKNRRGEKKKKRGGGK